MPIPDVFDLYVEALCVSLDLDVAENRLAAMTKDTDWIASPEAQEQRRLMSNKVRRLSSRKEEALELLRSWNESRYWVLLSRVEWLTHLQVGEFDVRLREFCLAWRDCGRLDAALKLAQRLAVADGSENQRIGRAQLLAELGDEEGAAAALSQGEATAQRRREHRVFVDPRTEKQSRQAAREAARAEKQAELERQQRRRGADVEAQQLDWAA